MARKHINEHHVVHDYSNQLRRLTRKATKIFEQNIAKDVRNNPKRFWKYAASKTKVKSKIPDLYTSDDESPNDMTENDQEKAEKLGSFFLKRIHKWGGRDMGHC